MNKKLVVFDLDGTLYNTEKTVVAAVTAALSNLNYEYVSKELILGAVGETFKGFCRKIMPDLSEFKTEELIEKIRLYERKFVVEQGELFDGIPEMLKELKSRGYFLAICSNGSQSYIEIVLDTFKIGNLFDAIKFKNSSKSKSDLIIEIMNELKTYDAVMVGDRIHDFDAAKICKIPSIAVSYGYGKDEIEKADYIAENPQKILQKVEYCNLMNEIYINSMQKAKPLIIGVNGVDTSGKTTFSIDLARYYTAKGHKTQLIHLDDFHNEKAVRSRGENEIEAYFNNAFNLDRLKNELLIPIKNGTGVEKTLKLLDLDSDNFIKMCDYKADSDTIVIVEGVLLFRPPIDKYFNLKIFIDITFEEVLSRALIRDVPKCGMEFLEKYKNKYIPVQGKYIKTYKPKEISDFVIDNNNWSNPKITN